jgi:hypothetical protein
VNTRSDYGLSIRQQDEMQSLLFLMPDLLEHSGFYANLAMKVLRTVIDMSAKLMNTNGCSLTADPACTSSHQSLVWPSHPTKPYAV